jgi:GNAT superfamily N-acetyltransferase
MIVDRGFAPAPNPLELIELQARTLFRHDSAGRLTSINEPGEQPAPQLFLGRTPSGNIWRYRYDLPPDLIDELDAILSHEPIANNLREPPMSLQCLLDTLERQTPVERIWQGPAWHVPETVTAYADSEPIVVADLELLSATFGGSVESWVESAPCLAIVNDGWPVSACFSARTSLRASEAGVETLPAFRRQGYASAVTAAWARHVRAAGRIPLYSTSWDNLASQHVARRLGLQLYAADLHIT